MEKNVKICVKTTEHLTFRDLVKTQHIFRKNDVFPQQLFFCNGFNIFCFCLTRKKPFFLFPSFGTCTHFDNMSYLMNFKFGQIFVLKWNWNRKSHKNALFFVLFWIFSASSASQWRRWQQELWERALPYQVVSVPHSKGYKVVSFLPSSSSSSSSSSE